ncbi:ABC-2 type transport system ATP-binding protein [Austwickia chelonae]|uniref:Putative ABC transporter ATP-binding protein n=1 Tax=Austwickia chelonae NBRC 105200 TaxID=1184607 RepID=K6VA02_9MICO|nr:ABC transporter ATP-binding protein [Austwickia chelonae]GAB79048.1 putative ABC transporter ATP-binding protein [Austwickia chelonae NBRC 105200]SEW41870.1 ABC-2 type transport system ATP-binding protein [Austwickia chelonae]
MTAVIDIADLHKSYGTHRALRGIDLHLAPGEVYGFIGPNGAGKTTTMRILLDILRPDRGTVRLLGQDPRTGGATLRSRIGYLPGELRLDGRYDVATLLDHYLDLSTHEQKRRLPSWIPLAERLGLDPTRQVRGLSKGNKQKVGLVQAFMHQPELLILDEPTSGLDPLVQAEFITMVREVQQDGRTIFLSSHVLSEVEHTADRVAILREGLIAQESTVDELRHSLGLRLRLSLAEKVGTEHFIGLPGVRTVTVAAPRPAAQAETTDLVLDLDGTPDAVVKTASRYTVLSLEAERPDLEEVVMRLYTHDDQEGQR